jgi:molybdate transport system substrate-binding protein
MAIPARLSRGEKADVVIMARSALDALVKQGVVLAGSQVDLAGSRIGMAVRAGASRPDISTVEAFKRTLLKAHSVAYSDSASGVYLSKVLFERLGIVKEMEKKSHQIPGEPVAAVVARGDAEIGFQQMSELLPVSGIRIVGPIPDELQKVTVFSSGIVAKSSSKEAAQALIRFLSSPAACAIIERNALDPIACTKSSRAAKRSESGGGN